MTIEEWEDKLKESIVKNVKTIIEHLNDGDTFVDIGANTGLLTQLVIDGMKSDGKQLKNVVMFEPIEMYYNECVNKFGDKPNFIIENLALSDDDTDKTIYASQENFGYNKIYKQGMEVQPHDKYIIKCKTFSNWMLDGKIDKINFIKIDAEGHDIEIIYGMLDWLRSSNLRPYILFERGWYEDRETELANILKDDFNYIVEDLGTDWLLKQK
jgi:FkbM family methyltransferase